MPRWLVSTPCENRPTLPGVDFDFKKFHRENKIIVREGELVVGVEGNTVIFQNGNKEDFDVVLTGAGVTQSDALGSDVIQREVPLLAMALPWVGHFQTRNRGTLGGSVAHADPSAEIPLALVTCGGTVVLQSRRGQRRLPAREFFVGVLMTQRRSDEIVTALEWPRSAPDTSHAFAEVAQRHGDFAIAAAACSLRLDGLDRIEELSLGVGGVEGRPVAIEVNSFVGRQAGEIAAALSEHAAATLMPMEDHSVSADYRTALTEVLVGRAVNSALDMARQRRSHLQ